MRGVFWQVQNAPHHAQGFEAPPCLRDLSLHVGGQAAFRGGGVRQRARRRNLGPHRIPSADLPCLGRDSQGVCRTRSGSASPAQSSHSLCSPASCVVGCIDTPRVPNDHWTSPESVDVDFFDRDRVWRIACSAGEAVRPPRGAGLGHMRAECETLLPSPPEHGARLSAPSPRMGRTRVLG
jgi:hypothetical protein